jgi:hypothetical protein
MGILVAMALGTALASAARTVGQQLTERTNPDLLAQYRHMHDHRIDCFLLGSLSGWISLATTIEASSQIDTWMIGLLVGFAALPGTGGVAEARAGSTCQRALSNVFGLLLGPVAVVAGWLCASAMAASLLDF